MTDRPIVKRRKRAGSSGGAKNTAPVSKLKAESANGADKANGEITTGSNPQQMSINTRRAESTVTNLVNMIASDSIKVESLIDAINRGLNKKVVSLNSSKQDVIAELLNNTDLNRRNQIIEELGIDSKTVVMNSGRSITYSRYIIPADEVLKRTCVHPLNPRNQEVASEVDVLSVLQTIEENQEQVAYGEMGEDGIIQLYDGSRRRLSTIIANVNLAVYVTRTPITPLEFYGFHNSQEEVNESKQQLSIVERAKMFLKMITEFDFPISQVASINKCTEQFIKDTLPYADIDDKFVQLTYAPSKIGKSNANKLMEIIAKSKDAGVDTDIIVEESVKFKAEKSIDLNALKLLSLKEQNNNLVTHNTRILKHLLSFIESKSPSVGVDVAGSSPRFENILSFKSRGRKTKVEAKSLTKSNGSTVNTVKITNCPQDVWEALLPKFLDMIKLESDSPN